MSELDGDHGVELRVEGAGPTKIGRITLNRPKAMNALTRPGGLEMDARLIDWAADPSIGAVLIEGAGEKAFCAGGDVAKLYQTGIAGDFAYARGFWAEEYRMNARISTYAKPFVALMDGVTMGGGVGVSAHGSHRIVTERSLLAMPEAGIGLLPDAGGLWLLSRAPGHLGEYLALTGARMGAADAIHAGFADSYMALDQIEPAIEALLASGDVEALTPFYSDPGESALAPIQAEIDRIFALETPLEICAALEASDAAWAAKALKAIRAASPLIVAGALDGVRRARALDKIEDALTLELRFNWRVIEHGEFLEGVRALLIDKDKTPRWNPPSLEELKPGQIAAMFESLGADELTF